MVERKSGINGSVTSHMQFDYDMDIYDYVDDLEQWEIERAKYMKDLENTIIELRETMQAKKALEQKEKSLKDKLYHEYHNNDITSFQGSIYKCTLIEYDRQDFNKKEFISMYGERVYNQYLTKPCHIVRFDIR